GVAASGGPRPQTWFPIVVGDTLIETAPVQNRDVPHRAEDEVVVIEQVERCRAEPGQGLKVAPGIGVLGAALRHRQELHALHPLGLVAHDPDATVREVLQAPQTVPELVVALSWPDQIHYVFNHGSLPFSLVLGSCRSLPPEAVPTPQDRASGWSGPRRARR